MHSIIHLMQVLWSPLCLMTVGTSLAEFLAFTFATPIAKLKSVRID